MPTTPPPLLPLSALRTIDHCRLRGLLELALCLDCDDCFKHVIHEVVRSRIHHGNCDTSTLTRIYKVEFVRYFDQVYCRGNPAGLRPVTPSSILPAYRIGPRLVVSHVEAAVYTAAPPVHS